MFIVLYTIFLLLGYSKCQKFVKCESLKSGNEE